MTNNRFIWWYVITPVLLGLVFFASGHLFVRLSGLPTIFLVFVLPVICLFVLVSVSRKRGMAGKQIFFGLIFYIASAMLVFLAGAYLMFRNWN